MGKKLEIATNVIVIAVGISVLWALTQSYRSKPADIPDSLRPGARVQAAAELNLPAGGRTLLLFVRKGCHFCEESLPFYQRLNNAVKTSGNKAGLLALFPDPPSDAAATLGQAGVDIRYAASLNFSRFGVAATPTLLLVDATGKIQKTWIGKLSSDKEEEVIRALALATSARR